MTRWCRGAILAGMGDEPTMPRARRYLGLAAVVTTTSVLLSGLALVGLVPATVAATAAVRELDGHADPLGRLLARPPTRSVVRAADGSVPAVLHGGQDRVAVPLSAVPVTVRDAVLAAEGARFYDHGPLDLRGGPVYGGTFPALIFRQYMAAALAGRPVADLPDAGPARTRTAGPRLAMP